MLAVSSTFDTPKQAHISVVLMCIVGKYPAGALAALA
jgi:hypothetical protein